jgi:hypothetical protein
MRWRTTGLALGLFGLLAGAERAAVHLAAQPQVVPSFDVDPALAGAAAAVDARAGHRRGR